MSFLTEIGCARVINAAGTFTAFGGCKMTPRTLSAMSEIAQSFVDIERFGQMIGAKIAGMLGVDSSMVVAGASAGLALAVAASIAGNDPAKRTALPHAIGPSNIIIPRCHRNPYDHAIRIGGGRIVEVGDAIHTSGEDVEMAIDQDTAAIVFVLQSTLLAASPSLEEVIDVAQRHALPLIVDAAAELPPTSNLWELSRRGCDLVIFSGGKDLRGPPASGLVVGKERLIERMQFQSIPNYGLGRPMKASKEAIAGLYTALKAYLEVKDDERFAIWNQRAAELASMIEPLLGWRLPTVQPTQPRVQPSLVPRLELKMPTVELAATLQSNLLEDNPAVAVDRWRETIILNVQVLEDDEIPIVADRVASHFQKLRP